KIVHFTFYLVAAVLGSFAFRERTKGSIGLLKTTLIIGISVIIYGIIIEVIQDRFTVHRSGEFLDVLANGLGAFVGVFVIKLLFSGKRQLKWKI
ncbi:MAG: VanZ family protein, partial [Flavobacteriaceae bacterium]